MDDWKKNSLNDLHTKGEIVLKVKAIPQSLNTKFVQLLKGDETVVKIAVAAAPERGRANAELLKFLEREFDCRAEIMAGSADRVKLVKLKK